VGHETRRKSKGRVRRSVGHGGVRHVSFTEILSILIERMKLVNLTGVRQRGGRMVPFGRAASGSKAVERL
jgi:hypothetical protein